jgi:flagellar hook-basal body complex protein FliE
MPLEGVQAMSAAFPSLRPIPVNPPKAQAMIPGVELRELRPEVPQLRNRPGLEGPTAPGVSGPGYTVESAIESFVHAVDEKSKVAGRKVSALMAGEDMSLGETMVSLQESQISFELMVEVRNRLLEGYQELMRMQV